ncbi:MAG: hypothetical protein LBC42_03075, partial [Puniceicoccales bacterium]|nr:hypothetical protein [Puniceicoccales bacterium]
FYQICHDFKYLFNILAVPRTLPRRKMDAKVRLSRIKNPWGFGSLHLHIVDSNREIACNISHHSWKDDKIGSDLEIANYRVPQFVIPHQKAMSDQYTASDFVPLRGEGTLYEKVKAFCSKNWEDISTFANLNIPSAFRLMTDPATSIYVRRNIVDNGLECTGRSWQQTDMNEVRPGRLISPSPTERLQLFTPTDDRSETIQATDNANKEQVDEGLKPFFDALKLADVDLIVDLRKLDNFRDYFRGEFSPTYIEFCCEQEICPGLTVTIAKDTRRGNHITHLHCTTLADQTAFSSMPQWSQLMHVQSAVCVLAQKIKTGEIDPTELANLPQAAFIERLQTFQFEARFSSAKVLTHCNGGLGRAPTVTVAGALWEFARTAQAAGVERIYDVRNFRQLMVDGKLNMAAVLFQTLVVGNSSRSTFGQSVQQFQALRELARELASDESNAHLQPTTLMQQDLANLVPEFLPAASPPLVPSPEARDSSGEADGQGE